MEEATLPQPDDGLEYGPTGRSPRQKTVLNGKLETLGAKFDVAVRNISCTGAMVEGEAVPPPGRDLLLKAWGLEFFCSVIWSDGQRCGLHFDEPLSPQLVIALHNITPEEVRSAELKAAAEWYQSQGKFSRV